MLTKGWIALLLVTPVILGVVAGIVLRVLVFSWTWLAVVIGVAVALGQTFGNRLREGLPTIRTPGCRLPNVDRLQQNITLISECIVAAVY